MIKFSKVLQILAGSVLLSDGFVRAEPQHHGTVISDRITFHKQPEPTPSPVVSLLSKRLKPPIAQPSSEYFRGHYKNDSIPSNDKFEGTPDLRLLQRYWLPADIDGGMDVQFAHDNIKGALGEDIHVYDIGMSWKQNHDDLPKFQVFEMPKERDRLGFMHGTHVAGILVGLDNNKGVLGIVPNATFIGCSMYPTPKWLVNRLDFEDIHAPFTEYGRRAMKRAMKSARTGDVILWTRPHVVFQDYRHPRVPEDFEPEQFIAIRQATDRGVIVVLAAGNDDKTGGFSLDDDDFLITPSQLPPGDPWKNPWKAGNLWSGAIIVGAGAAAGHYDMDRPIGSLRFSRLGTSNFGPRIDVQARGERLITTTTHYARGFGYRLIYEGTHDDCYTDEFGGTAGAASLIAGVIASIQGVLKAEGLVPLLADDYRALFRDPTLGLAQVYHPDDKGWIGIQPNMKKLIPQAIYRARAKQHGTLKNATRFFGDGLKPHLQVKCFQALRKHFGDRADTFCTPESGLVQDNEILGSTGIW